MADRQECDVSKTQLNIDAFKFPQRSKRWSMAPWFLQQCKNGQLACGQPQTLIGQDRVTCFILKTPEERKPLESFCINNRKEDFLLAIGWGVVFNPTADKSADWVFTSGDIVNFFEQWIYNSHRSCGHWAYWIQQNGRYFKKGRKGYDCSTFSRLPSICHPPCA